jgi:3-hydroxyisobutyrate dehydrogenase
MKEKIGFIGLGIMGRGMTHNLIKAGFDVTVWNRTASRMEEFVKVGAKAATSPAEVAENCGIIFICVSDTPDVEKVVLGDHGVLEGLSAGKLIVDHSTISPKGTRDMASWVIAKGASWIDAPVSGGSEGAAKGTLSIMIGGEADHIERARPYLEAMGKTITHVGPLGSGQMVKLVNQILVVVNMLAVSEAMLFAQAGGLDLEKTINAVKNGAAGSWMLSMRGPQVMVRDWRPGFMIDLQQKDLRLALEAAEEMGIPLIATSMVSHMYRTLQKQGIGAEGNHALIKALEHLAGIEVGKTPN